MGILKRLFGKDEIDKKVEVVLTTQRERNIQIKARLNRIKATLNGEEDWFLRLDNCVKECITEGEGEK